MSGKGDDRRREDRAAVESNWDRIDWNARDKEKAALTDLRATQLEQANAVNAQRFDAEVLKELTHGAD